MAKGVTTLGYALLGLLAYESLSGYDLARRLKKPVGFFWPARHSQIYPELGLLEAEGLVTFRVVEQPDRPDKKVYEITEGGRAAMRAWVSSPLPQSTVRDELVLRAFCVWLANPAEARALFLEHARLHAETLAHYQDILRDLEQRHGGRPRDFHSPDFAAYVTLNCGIGHERQYVEWCTWVAETLGNADGAYRDG
jgi:DNA-binding PadR family transcriptional regulator